MDVFGDWGRNYIEGMAGLWCTITATTSGLTNMHERMHGLGYAESPTQAFPEFR